MIQFLVLVGIILFFGLYKGLLEYELLSKDKFNERLQQEFRSYNLTEEYKYETARELRRRFTWVTYMAALAFALATVILIPVVFNHVWASLGIFLTIVALPHVIRWARNIGR